MIRKSAQRQRTVNITYRDSKGEVSTREVEPYEFKDGGLYAYCYRRQNIRFFKADRIQHAKITNRTFIPRWPIKIQ